MLDQRLPRWPDNKTSLDQSIVSDGQRSLGEGRAKGAT